MHPLAASKENALEVRDLGVHFGQKVIFHNLSFDVKRGTSLAILGPNGTGKTLLSKALAGIIPHDGNVKWAGGTRLGYVPQKLDIERDLPLTGRDYLGAMAQVSRRSIHDVMLALEMLKMSPSAADSLIGTLSGGQFQGLLVACALIGRPNVLLLDEATAGVDEPGQELIQETIRRLQKDLGMTVLLISHELRVVYRDADNVLCLTREAVFCGPPRSILTPEMMARLYGAEPGYHVHDHDASWFAPPQLGNGRSRGTGGMLRPDETDDACRRRPFPCSLAGDRPSRDFRVGFVLGRLFGPHPLSFCPI